MKWKLLSVLFCLSLAVSYSDDWPENFQENQIYQIPGATLNELMAELKMLEKNLQEAEKDLIESKISFEAYKKKIETKELSLKIAMILSNGIAGSLVGEYVNKDFGAYLGGAFGLATGFGITWLLN